MQKKKKEKPRICKKRDKNKKLQLKKNLIIRMKHKA